MQSTPGSTTLPDGDSAYQCSNDAKGDGDGGLSGCRIDWGSHICQQAWRSLTRNNNAEPDDYLNQKIGTLDFQFQGNQKNRRVTILIPDSSRTHPPNLRDPKDQQTPKNEGLK